MPDTADSVVAPSRDLRPAAPGILSSVAPGEAEAEYDRHAAVYDRLIGNRVYNAVMWGLDPREYGRFTEEALAAGSGPFLDAGCGTLVFTAPLYRSTERPVVLVDRSVGMLEKGRERLAGGAATLIQADLHDLPFAPGTFETIGCFAMLHVLADPWRALESLHDRLRPGGRLFASMLVTDRAVGRAYLRVLQRAGEVGPPRPAAELEAAARRIFGGSPQVSRSGSMAWLRAEKAPA